MPEQPDFIKDSTEQMVLIPAGEFLMGSADKPTWILRFFESMSEGKDEKPPHKVYLDAYYIDKYEVTNEQYIKFLNEYGKDKDDNGNIMIYDYFKWKGIFNEKDGLSGGWIQQKLRDKWYLAKGYEKHPVVHVTWYGANQYAKFYGKRLPTEAEWEKACRAGSQAKYCFGHSEKELGEYAWDYRYRHSGWETHPVGTNKPNKWGIYDMHGNVWEWCSDWYDKKYYKNSPTNNPKGPESGRARVLRGGSWNSALTGACRSAHRYRLNPLGWGSFGNEVGFRCAR
jgi:formylglycine-generating enzyme required for sulfatase activity